MTDPRLITCLLLCVIPWLALGSVLMVIAYRRAENMDDSDVDM